MARRSGSRNEQFQRRVPADVLKVARGRKVSLSLSPETVGGTPVQTTVTLGDVLRFSLQTTDKALGDLRRADVMQQLAQTYAAILTANEKGPRRLTHQQRHALAGLIYKELDALFEADPVDAKWWQIVSDVTWDALTDQSSIPLIGAEANAARQMEELERYVGPFLDAILRKEHVIIIADEDRRELLFLSAVRLRDIAKKLKKNSEGDYSPDPVAAQIPKWEGVTTAPPSRPSTLTFDDLLTRWENEGDKAPGSIVAFRTAAANLSKYLGHNDPLRVSPDDIRGWRNALLAGGDRKRSAKTVNDSYLTHIGTLYRLGKREGLLHINPTEDIRAQEKRVAGKGGKVYTDDEVAALLALADKETDAHLRWMPWLLALTGARVSEIAQLWGKHVKPIDGIDAIIITPSEDGGRLKNANSERDVPIHPALIARGFLTFVQARGNGPLFYGGQAATPRPRKEGQVRHAAKGPANRLREWIRASGFTDPRKAPCHAFRHWFKTKCTRLGIDGDITRAIQGHAGKGVDADYQHIGEDIAALHEAICKIPVPKLTAATLGRPRESAGGSEQPHQGTSEGGQQ